MYKLTHNSGKQEGVEIVNMKRMAKKAMALTLAMCLTCTAVPTMANQNLKVN